MPGCGAKENALEVSKLEMTGANPTVQPEDLECWRGGSQILTSLCRENFYKIPGDRAWDHEARCVYSSHQWLEYSGNAFDYKHSRAIPASIDICINGFCEMHRNTLSSSGVGIGLLVKYMQKRLKLQSVTDVLKNLHMATFEPFWLRNRYLSDKGHLRNCVLKRDEGVAVTALWKKRCSCEQALVKGILFGRM